MSPADTLRRRLDQLGEERANINERELKLHADIVAVLAEATGVIPKTEVADRLGIHRTTLYRVYG